MGRAFFFLILLFSLDLYGVNKSIIPFKLEGVYSIQTSIVGNAEPLALEMTILQNIRTQSLTMTIAQAGTNVSYFFLRNIQFVEINPNLYRIFNQVSPSTMNQIVTEIDVFVDLDRMSIQGTLDGNFLKQPEPVTLIGHKEESFYEQWGRTGSKNCGSIEDYVGLFEGSFGDDRKSTLTIRLMEDPMGKKFHAANLSIGGKTRVLYQDGYFSESLQMLSLVGEFMFMMRGQVRKFLLMCDQDPKNFILKGVHISSSGRLVRNVEFKKRKVTPL